MPRQHTIIRPVGPEINWPQTANTTPVTPARPVAGGLPPLPGFEQKPSTRPVTQSSLRDRFTNIPRQPIFNNKQPFQPLPVPNSSQNGPFFNRARGNRVDNNPSTPPEGIGPTPPGPDGWYTRPPIPPLPTETEPPIVSTPPNRFELPNGTPPGGQPPRFVGNLPPRFNPTLNRNWNQRNRFTDNRGNFNGGALPPVIDPRIPPTNSAGNNFPTDPREQIDANFLNNNSQAGRFPQVPPNQGRVPPLPNGRIPDPNFNQPNPNENDRRVPDINNNPVTPPGNKGNPTADPRFTTRAPFGANTPAGLHPFPVPFLSRSPVAQAFPATTTPPVPTLPPGIILATARPPDKVLPVWTEPNRPSPFTPPSPWRPIDREEQPPWTPEEPLEEQEKQWPVSSGRNTLPPRVTEATTTLTPRRTTPPKKTAPHDPFRGPPDVSVGETFPYESSSGEAEGNVASAGQGGPGNATTTIAICLSVVVVVMVGVFVTLCVVRHRSYRRHAGSSTSGSTAAQARTSAYVAAQAAQMNYAAANYAGTLSRAPLRPTTAGNTQHTWIYTPGSYTSASNNYYK